MDVTRPLDFRKCHENCGSAFPSPSQTIQPLERAVEFRSALGEYTKTRILGWLSSSLDATESQKWPHGMQKLEAPAATHQYKDHLRRVQQVGRKV